MQTLLGEYEIWEDTHSIRVYSMVGVNAALSAPACSPTDFARPSIVWAIPAVVGSRYAPQRV